MPGISRVLQDTAEGIILGGGQSTVYVENKLVTVVNDSVQGHGPGLHAAPVMVGCSGTVKAGGKFVCRAGDEASCSHIATGSSTVIAG